MRRSRKTMPLIVMIILGFSLMQMIVHSSNLLASPDQNCDPSYRDVCIAPSPLISNVMMQL
jgi:hypothetical protein